MIYFYVLGNIYILTTMTYRKRQQKATTINQKIFKFFTKTSTAFKIKKKIKYYFLKETQNFNLIYTALEALTGYRPRIHSLKKFPK